MGRGRRDPLEPPDRCRPDIGRGPLSLVFGTPAGWALILIGNLVGLAFAALVLTLSVVSMPMLVDCDVDARTAIDTSIRAVMANKGPMFRWGLIVAALLVLGSIPAFVGLAVVLPVLGYSTWHLYAHTVVRDEHALRRDERYASGAVGGARCRLGPGKGGAPGVISAR